MTVIRPMNKRLTIVRGQRIEPKHNRRGRTYRPIRGLIRYLAFGRLSEQHADTVQRGQWLDHAGNVQSHHAVEQWAKDKVHRFGYDHAYQLLLSTGKGGLDSADFNTSLQAGSTISGVHEWRMMIHTDTGNQHAHAILFRRERLSKQAYLAWQQAMQQTLDKRQMQRLLEQEQSHERTLQQSQSAELTAPRQQAQSWGIEL